MPPKSKAQARFLGAVASGRARSKRGPTRAQAREMLRGAKLAKLPARKRSSARSRSRSTRARSQPRSKSGRFTRR
jgi:hypothetical protein